MRRQRENAEKFRALHARGRLLILPNAWDAASAKLAEEAGAQAIASLDFKEVLLHPVTDQYREEFAFLLVLG